MQHAQKNVNSYSQKNSGLSISAFNKPLIFPRNIIISKVRSLLVIFNSMFLIRLNIYLNLPKHNSGSALYTFENVEA